MNVPDTDLSLLQRFAETRDHTAFAEIVHRYAGVVYAACHRVLHNQAMAEEVSQETFFRLMKQPQAVSQSLGAWLHRAATNLAVDAVRSDSARRRRELEYTEDAAREHDAAAATDSASWAEISPFVDEALAELPDEDRILLIEHFLRGRPQNELAAEAKTSAATLSRRVRSAVEALQQKLRRRGLSAAPLALTGLLHDHALQAPPPTLTAELGKMTLVSHSSGLLGAPAAPKPPILWTATYILTASLAVGCLCARFGTSSLPKPSSPFAPAPPTTHDR